MIESPKNEPNKNSVESDDEYGLSSTFKKEKISPRNEEYLIGQKDKAENRSRNDVFGNGMWSSFYVYKNLKVEAAKPSFDKNVEKSRRQFCSFLSSQNQTTQENALNFVRLGFVDSREAREHMETFLAKKNLDDISYKNEEHDVEVLTSLFLKYIQELDHVDDDLNSTFAYLYQGNIDGINRLQTEFEKEKLPILKKLFLTVSMPTLRSWLNLSKDEYEKMIKRIDSVSVCLVDGLTAELEGIGGYYNHGNNQISIGTTYLDTDEVEHIFTHELIHLISGRLIIRETTIYDGENSFTQDGEGRIGLHFSSLSHSRFQWLNEGITELLTSDLVNQSIKYLRVVGGGENKDFKSDVYRGERALVSFLCKSGKVPIPFKMFAEAFFEDYEQKEDGNTIPKWKNLQKAINESFGSGFLVYLDKLIEEKGIKAALLELKNKKF